MITSRFFVFNLTVALTVLFLALSFAISPDLAWPLAVLLPLTLLGVYDLIQPHHSILRNYPLMGHFRFIFEYIRPEIRQYLIEDERDPLPFSRDQRAQNASDMRPFGTVLDTSAIRYGWVSHSVMPVEKRCRLPHRHRRHGMHPAL